MKNIGVIMPYIDNNANFVKKFIKRHKCEVFPVTEYGFNFIVVYDNQNCSKLLNKHGVNSIVVLTDAELEYCDFGILDGDSMFKRMLPEFVRKTAKGFGVNCSVTLVDKNMSDYGMSFAEKLCDICNYVFIYTQNISRAELLCERLLDKYGVVVNIIKDKSPINTNLAVVIEGCGNRYGENCVVIDKNLKKGNNRVINDFYIPFRIKPPFGMSNLVFAECTEVIKVVDIH